MQYTPTVRQGYINLWNKMAIRPQYQSLLDEYARDFANNRPRYEKVEAETGVPWWFIALVHKRESDCDFSTHLANGDPLDRPTTHEPKGRGPFSTWEEGAVDALRYMGLDKVTDWSLPHALYQFERYNGFGYVGHVNSPYVWSWSNLYSQGKYIADGKYSSTFIDPQPGCAPMLKSLILLVPSLAGQILGDLLSPATTTTTPKTTTNQGITVSKAQNLATHILAAIGSVIGVLGFSSLHSIWDTFTTQGGLFGIGGLVVSTIAAWISHLTVVGANDNTIDIIDKVIQDITPHSSLIQQAVADKEGGNAKQ